MVKKESHKHNPSYSEHTRLSLERKKKFYPVPPHTHGNNDWNHYFQYQQLAPYHCSQPERNEQLTLPSYWSSQITRDSNILHTPRTRATTSSLVLGKCPTMRNPAQSFFQSSLPPSSVLGKRPIMSKSNHPRASSECRRQSDELLRLVQSMGKSEFLASSGKVLRSGSSLRDHLPSPSDHIPVRGTRASSMPNLLLGLGNGSDIDKGKGKEGHSYWDLDDMVEMESMNKRQMKVTSQPVPDLTVGCDIQGGSKNKIN
ncbi:unnamed protein product [Urochloa humidicola]